MANDISDTLDFAFWKFQQGKTFEESRSAFTADIEHLDMKREYLMNGYIYFILSIKFEGFEPEFESQK